MGGPAVNDSWTRILSSSTCYNIPHEGNILFIAKIITRTTTTTTKQIRKQNKTIIKKHKSRLQRFSEELFSRDFERFFFIQSFLEGRANISDDFLLCVKNMGPTYTLANERDENK